MVVPSSGATPGRIARAVLSARLAVRSSAVVLATAMLPAAFAAPLSITVVDQRDRPLANAAVSVLVDGIAARDPKATAMLGQRQKRFVPELLVVQSGTSVTFPNEDTVRHHVYSFSSIRPFEIKLYVGTPAAPVVFDKPGTAVLGCNIHDQMVGYIHVVDTPYFAVTDERGSATLDVPAGGHRLRAWHPDLGQESPPAEAGLVVAASGAASMIRLAID
jgi:plastocyanin